MAGFDQQSSLLENDAEQHKGTSSRVQKEKPQKLHKCHISSGTACAAQALINTPTQGSLGMLMCNYEGSSETNTPKMSLKCIL